MSNIEKGSYSSSMILMRNGPMIQINCLDFNVNDVKFYNIIMFQVCFLNNSWKLTGYSTETFFHETSFKQAESMFTDMKN